ncbi:hypothetical protein D3C75_518490 [compost metagenome]
MSTDHAQRRDRVASQLEGNEHRRDGVGDDQYHVLGHLGVGDALHAAEYRVAEHHGSGDPDAGRVAHFEEAGEGNTGTSHLTDHVGQGDQQQADDSGKARTTAVEAITDEVRYGELAELAQVGRQQHGQQHVTTGPAHQVDRSGVAASRDDTGHGDEGRCGHPVGRSGHTVGYRVHAATGDVELLGRSGACPDCDTEVESEGRPHE